MENKDIWKLSCTFLLLWCFFMETAFNIAVGNVHLWSIKFWMICYFVSIKKSGFGLPEGKGKRYRSLYGKKYITYNT